MTHASVMRRIERTMLDGLEGAEFWLTLFGVDRQKALKDIEDTASRVLATFIARARGRARAEEGVQP